MIKWLKRFFGINRSQEILEEQEEILEKKKKLKNRLGSSINSSKAQVALKVVTPVMLLGSVFTAGYAINNKFEITSKGEIGIEAVTLMYNFNNVTDLEENLVRLEKITTKEVYKQIAVTNADKSLSTYLKFKQNPVEVEVLESRPGIVIYTLHCDSLTDGRVFIFTYGLNWQGKIDYVRELEGIDFY